MIKKIGKINPRLRWILIVLLAILVLLILLRRAGADGRVTASLALPNVALSTKIADRPGFSATTQPNAQPNHAHATA